MNVKFFRSSSYRWMDEKTLGFHSEYVPVKYGYNSQYLNKYSQTHRHMLLLSILAISWEIFRCLYRYCFHTVTCIQITFLIYINIYIKHTHIYV